MNLDGASIEADASAPGNIPTIRLPNHEPSSLAPQLAIDIGGSMIKLVYFSRFSSCEGAAVGGRLHFQVFETSRMDECVEFLKTILLPDAAEQADSTTPRLTVKATGGGAFKFAKHFEEQCGIVFDKEDEARHVHHARHTCHTCMHTQVACIIAGANYMLRNIRDEAFTHHQGNTRCAPPRLSA